MTDNPQPKPEPTELDKILYELVIKVIEDLPREITVPEVSKPLKYISKAKALLQVHIDKQVRLARIEELENLDSEHQSSAQLIMKDGYDHTIVPSLVIHKRIQELKQKEPK